MSRVASNPIPVLDGVEVKLDGQLVTVKGKLGQLTREMNAGIAITQNEKVLQISYKEVANKAQAGTERALINNMVVGVAEGFERKLEMVGVGYRAQVQGKKLNITAGFSHPVSVNIPDEVSITTPSQTEIVIKGKDKQIVGQLAANIRAIRPPEPYKGKGIRYAGEVIVRKEGKKK